MIKRILAVILVLCMSLSAAGALAYEDVEEGKKTVAVELVTGLEIMNPDSEIEFGSITLVKRGEFALYAARLAGYDVTASSSAKGYFDDVDVSTLEGAAVELLASAGVIPKTGREFNPNDEITYVEAVRILLNCLGYEATASVNGGFPGGYIKTATECELNKNIGKMTNSVLTKADTAMLLYNALFVYPMELNQNGYKKSDKTLLEKTRNVYEITGVVTGYEKTYLGDKELAENCVEINGEVFDAGNSSIKDYVGYSVKAYYSKANDGEQKIVAFTEKQNANTVTVINADDIEIKDSKVTYYVNNSRKTLKVSESAAVIYNGLYYSNYDKLEDVLNNIAEGEVTFISNDSSSKANVIIVKEYKHLLVERVDGKGGRLYLKNGSPTEDTVPYLPDTITLAAYDKTAKAYVESKVYLDGKEIRFSDIKADDAVTMEMSMDGEDAVLYVSRETVTGKITSVSADEIGIDGVRYPISAYCVKEYASGTSGTFAITTDGKFLGLSEAKKSDGIDYAYVLDAYSEPGPNKAYVELYTSKGEVITYECASNIKVNKIKRKFNEIPDYVLKSEIITYKANKDGEVTQINRPFDASSKLNYVNETQFIKNWNKSSVRYTDGIMGMSFITEDTLIFSMPRFDRDNPSDYRILNVSDLTNRTYADVTCYDVDRQGRAGVVLIVEDFSDSVSMGNNLFFVKESSITVDEDDNIVHKIDGYENGEEKTLVFTEDTSSVTYEDGWMNYSGNEDFDTGYENLKAGDALQYSLDNDGDVNAYRLVYNNNKTICNKDGSLKDDFADSYYEDWSKTGSVTKQDFYDDLYISFGDVQSRFMDYVLLLGLNMTDRLAYESSSSPIRIIDYYRPINLLNASVYVYYINSDELELGDMEDVQKGDSVFVRSKKMGEVNEIMVYVEE